MKKQLLITTSSIAASCRLDCFLPWA